jgi:hypothetical protein
MKDKGNNSLPPKGNYSISLEEIKSLNFFDYLEAIGASLSKKKSSKYGRYYKWQNYSLWVRYDYKTKKYFYINLTGNDKGTLIDFLQEHIINERNLGKVKRYVSDNQYLFF